MLAGGGIEWHEAEVPKPPTSRNAERQKVLPPPASDCHSLPKWRSSPSRVRHNPRIPRGKEGGGKKATQKTTHSEGSGSPQEVAGSRKPTQPVPIGCLGNPSVWFLNFF